MTLFFCHSLFFATRHRNIEKHITYIITGAVFVGNLCKHPNKNRLHQNLPANSLSLIQTKDGWFRFPLSCHDFADMRHLSQEVQATEKQVYTKFPTSFQTPYASSLMGFYRAPFQSVQKYHDVKFQELHIFHDFCLYPMTFLFHRKWLIGHLMVSCTNQSDFADVIKSPSIEFTCAVRVNQRYSI